MPTGKADEQAQWRVHEVSRPGLSPAGVYALALDTLNNPELSKGKLVKAVKTCLKARDGNIDAVKASSALLIPSWNCVHY